MATTIEVVDGAAFQESMASVRNDTTEDRFIICGHVDGDPNRVQVRLKQVFFSYLCMLTQRYFSVCWPLCNT